MRALYLTITAGACALAFTFASAEQAQAQTIRFGVGFQKSYGNPTYYNPGFGRGGFYPPDYRYRPGRYCGPQKIVVPPRRFYGDPYFRARPVYPAYRGYRKRYPFPYRY